MLTHPSVSVRYTARDSNRSHANASEERFCPPGIAVDPPECKTSPGILTQNDWTLIVDRSKRSVFKKGEILAQQGKQIRTVYLLVRGKAAVEALSRALIAHIGPGEVCGEMAFLENGVASATVTAEEEVEVCAIEWSVLLDLFELFPHLGSRFYRSLAVNLSRRMRELIASRQSASKLE